MHATCPWSRRALRRALPADWGAGCGAAVLIHFFRADPSSSHAGLARTAAVPRGRKRPEASRRAGRAGRRRHGEPGRESKVRRAPAKLAQPRPPRRRPAPARRYPAPASPRAPDACPSAPGRGARPAVGTESPAQRAGGTKPADTWPPVAVRAEAGRLAGEKRVEGRKKNRRSGASGSAPVPKRTFVSTRDLL